MVNMSLDRTFLIAVDFGTTYSAVAWTQTRKDQSVSDPDIRVINTWKNGDTQLQVPTVLRKADNGEWKWGHEIETTQDRYEWFKLEQDSALASRLGLKQKYSPMAIQPQDAAEVEKLVTQYLTLLKIHTEDSIKNTFKLDSLMRRSTQQYIITVPAVWSVRAQNMTLRCAKKAGMALSSEPRVISEPEAAAIYGLGRAIKDVRLEVGDTFVICDAGGGTVDLISYKITELDPSPSVIEAAAGSGDLCGSTFLDREFASWLKTRFHHLAEWDEGYVEDAMERWTDIKKGFDGKKVDNWTFRARGLKNNERLHIHGGTYEVTPSHVKQIFEPVIQKILVLVQSQITESRKENSTPVKAVLLAGGFGNNPYLKARIQQAVGKAIMVERMHDTETAVVRGALLQGLADAQPTIRRANIQIKSRKARNHFGVAVLDTYQPAKHDPTRPRYPMGARGSERIEVMQWFITQGKDVTESETYSFEYYFDEPVRAVKRKDGVLESFTMPIYVWTHDLESRPEYPPLGATGSGCKKIIELKADMNRIPENARNTTNGAGEKYYEIPFTIDMKWHSANIDFKLLHTAKDGQKYPCGAGSIKADYLQ